ncbi:MAG: hypothetical protein ACREHG_02535 [Candidatus Saccharimonadales bacterium]
MIRSKGWEANLEVALEGCGYSGTLPLFLDLLALETRVEDGTAELLRVLPEPPVFFGFDDFELEATSSTQSLMRPADDLSYALQVMS